MIYLFIAHLVLVLSGFSQNTSELIYLENDQLVYVPFSMEGQTNKVNTIPDFSYAGYMGGGVELPTDISVEVTVTPETGDDAPRIQDAIQFVAMPVVGFVVQKYLQTEAESLERA